MTERKTMSKHFIFKERVSILAEFFLLIGSLAGTIGGVIELFYTEIQAKISGQYNPSYAFNFLFNDAPVPHYIFMVTFWAIITLGSVEILYALRNRRMRANRT